MRGDFLRTMKKGEVAIMLLAHFSKAFPLLEPDSYNQVISTLRFSKSFLRWLNSYFSDRSRFIQMDDRTSESVNLRFGVPQGDPWPDVTFVICIIITLPRLVYFNTMTILQSTSATKMCARTKLHPKHCELLV